MVSPKVCEVKYKKSRIIDAMVLCQVHVNLDHQGLRMDCVIIGYNIDCRMIELAIILYDNYDYTMLFNLDSITYYCDHYSIQFAYLLDYLSDT